MQKYEKKGQVAAGAVSSVIVLMIGMVIVAIVTVFGGAIAGTAYQVSETQINTITNETIKGYIKDSAIESFKAMKQTSSYTPLVFLGVIVFIVLSMVVGLMAFTGGGMGGGRGGAL